MNSVSRTDAGLEAVAARRPDLFYADALLGTWHRRTQDQAAANLHSDRAESEAPAVPVQRFRHADGRRWPAWIPAASSWSASG